MANQTTKLETNDIYDIVYKIVTTIFFKAPINTTKYVFERAPYYKICF